MGWRYIPPDRRCAQCGQELDGRADQRYCSPTCRSRASRSRRLSLAGDVITWLSDEHWADAQADAAIPGRDPALAASASTEAAAGMIELLNGDGPMWRRKVTQIFNRRPDLIREFTQSVIEACARPRGVGGCRWCDALSRAAMADEVITHDAATVRLLGGMCDRCHPLTASATPAPVTAGAPPSSGKGAPAMTAIHPLDECVTCAVADLALAETRRRGWTTLAEAKHHDAELANVAARRAAAHQPLPGPRPTGIYRSHGGTWRLRYPRGAR
jgi:hypothetical protein